MRTNRRFSLLKTVFHWKRPRASQPSRRQPTIPRPRAENDGWPSREEALHAPWSPHQRQPHRPATSTVRPLPKELR